MSQATQQPSKTARELGYRLPAEFEPVAAVWVAPPIYEKTWPGCLPEAQWEHELFCHALRPHVEVKSIAQLGIPYNDSWIRDYGPIFVKRDAQSPATAMAGLCCHDFHFNSWGGKYGVRELDDAVPQHIAKHLNIPVWTSSMVLEGGSIDVNGVGTVLTTEQCLLNRNRNPNMSRAQIEQALHDALGTRHVIWLPGGIVGDDTDGHVDDLARFVSKDTVVAVRAPHGHPDHPMLERNWAVLSSAVDQDGRKLSVIPLPAPEPTVYPFPAGPHQVPASYANFLIANDVVVVPIFRQKSDDAALRVIEQALPGRRVIGCPANHLVVGLGAIHCLTMQQPR